MKLCICGAKATRSNGRCGPCQKDHERQLLDATRITWVKDRHGVMRAVDVFDLEPDGPPRRVSA